MSKIVNYVAFLTRMDATLTHAFCVRNKKGWKYQIKPTKFTRSIKMLMWYWVSIPYHCRSFTTPRNSGSWSWTTAAPARTASAVSCLSCFTWWTTPSVCHANPQTFSGAWEPFQRPQLWDSFSPMPTLCGKELTSQGSFSHGTGSSCNKSTYR